jgi:hypothetical protein
MRTRLALFGGVGLIVVGLAGAAELPEVQEGLWERHGESVAMPGNIKSESKLSICRSHASEKAAQALARNIPGCPWVEPTITGSKFTQEMRCTVGATTIASKGVVSFQGETAIHSETHVTYTPPLGGIAESTAINDEKFVGSCAAGMEPGDTMNDKGVVQHRR